MPVLTSPEIAAKFKAKWMMLHPEDKDNVSGYVHLDDSLTSLRWLQDFSIRSANLEKPPGSGSHPQHLLHHRHQSPQGTDSPASPPAGDTAATGMPRSLGSPITSSASASTRDSSYLHQQQAMGHVYHQSTAAPICPPEELDYKTNRRVKPPYSYATLICMAMQASKKSKITLSAIYNWITDNFCYYKHADPSWQNSIRHNLSLNKCFMKVPRQKDEPGKGGFWQIDPQYADMFVDGVFKRRRMPSAHYGAQRQGPEASGKRQSVTKPQAAFGGPYPGPGLANKRKQPSLRRSSKGARGSKSPLLAAEAKETAILKGDFHWASTFDEGPGGKDSNFEDLDINMALSSLGCELELSLQGRHPVVGGRWCSNGAEHACGYMEVSSADDPQPQLHPQHMEEFTLFLDQSPHPWEELKEEVQATPLSLEHSFSFCEGFFSEMQPWDRGESYL